MKRSLLGPARKLGLIATSLLLAATAACGDDDPAATPDAPPPPPVPDAPGVCDPVTVLPATYRPIPKTSTGMVTITDPGATITTATVDATAGGILNAADNPYIYVDLKTGTKVEITDLDALTSTAWDIALKRNNLRANGGDSGKGNRKLSVVQAADLEAVTAAPSTGYTTDKFADENCALIAGLIGDPMSAFGNWYDYDENKRKVTPKAEVYVVERADGSHSAVEIRSYYVDEAAQTGSATFTVRWKQL